MEVVEVVKGWVKKMVRNAVWIVKGGRSGDKIKICIGC